jgi:hypothetical protein
VKAAGLAAYDDQYVVDAFNYLWLLPPALELLRRLKTRFFTRQIFRDVRYVSMSEASNHPYYRLSTIGKHNHAKLVDQNCRLRVPLGFLVVLKWRDHVL